MLCQFLQYNNVNQPCMLGKSLLLCLTHCNSMFGNLPGSSVQGILQVRILEWVARSSSRGPSQPKDGTMVSNMFFIGRQVLYHQYHLGNPRYAYIPSLWSFPPMYPTSHPSRSSQSTKLSSLSYTAVSHQPSILYMVLYICQCYSLNQPTLSFLGCVQKFLHQASWSLVLIRI